MARRDNNMRTLLIDTIGFLNWTKVDPEYIKFLNLDSIGVDPDKVYISPDTNSLHIAWMEVGVGVVFHEMADYPYNGEMTLDEFLSDNIGGSSWDLHEGASLPELITDDGLGDVKDKVWSPGYQLGDEVLPPTWAVN